MLTQDLRGEENAIACYKERIAQAEALREYGLRRVLEDILIQEEEHKRDLLTVLGRWGRSSPVRAIGSPLKRL